MQTMKLNHSDLCHNEAKGREQRYNENHVHAEWSAQGQTTASRQAGRQELSLVFTGIPMAMSGNTNTFLLINSGNVLSPLLTPTSECSSAGQ